jgi:hypothetical protein
LGELFGGVEGDYYYTGEDGDDADDEEDFEEGKPTRFVHGRIIT